VSASSVFRISPRHRPGEPERWVVESLAPDGSWDLEGTRASQSRAIDLADAVQARA
jgi:hypothetical protein